MNMIKLWVRLDARIENGNCNSLALPGDDATCNSTGRETIMAKISERFGINFDGRQGALDLVRVTSTGSGMS